MATPKATKKKPVKKPVKKVAQNSKYKDDYARQARVACSEGGFTDAKLAKLFAVSAPTITVWKRDHADFKTQVRAGKDEYDCESAENSLLKRVNGYQYDEIVSEINPETGVMTQVKSTRREVVGDVKAQTFWLRNRNRERWPDSQNISGSLSVTMTHEQMLDELE